MKIIIFTHGSRGDMDPFIALGLCLKNRGHEVCVSGDMSYQTRVEDLGLEFSSVPLPTVKSLMDSAFGKMFSSGIPFLSLVSAFFYYQKIKKLVEVSLDYFLESVGSYDIVINNITVLSCQAAEKLDKACVSVSFWPSYPTKSYSSPILPFVFPKKVNLYTYYLSEIFKYILYHGPINKWRRRHAMPRLTIRNGINHHVRLNRFPHLLAYSESFIGHPADLPDNVITTGYWSLEERDIMKPEGLSEFIMSGERPIYMGFGSISSLNKEKILTMLKKTLESSGRRAVVSLGYAQGLDKSCPNIFHVEDIDNLWLFSQMDVVVHHGGSGTVGTVLKAGVPSIVVPFFSDQFFWADQLTKRNLAYRLSRKKLNSRNLLKILSKIEQDTTIRNNCIDISKKIQAENGICESVKILEEYAAKTLGLEFANENNV